MTGCVPKALWRPEMKHALFLCISALTLACLGCGKSRAPRFPLYQLAPQIPPSPLAKRSRWMQPVCMKTTRGNP